MVTGICDPKKSGAWHHRSLKRKKTFSWPGCIFSKINWSKETNSSCQGLCFFCFLFFQICSPSIWKNSKGRRLKCILLQVPMSGRGKELWGQDWFTAKKNSLCITVQHNPLNAIGFFFHFAAATLKRHEYFFHHCCHVTHQRCETRDTSGMCSTKHSKVYRLDNNMCMCKNKHFYESFLLFLYSFVIEALFLKTKIGFCFIQSQLGKAC